MRSIAIRLGYYRLLVLLAITASVPIWIGTAFGFLALYEALGHPTGTPSAVLGIGYLVASIGLTALAIAWLVRWLRSETSQVEREALGSGDSADAPLRPNQVDAVVMLPTNWKAGLSPEASREAWMDVQQAEVLGYAYDAARGDTEYQTTLVVRFFPPYPGQPQDAGARLRGIEDNISSDVVVDLDRVSLPVGDAVRFEARYPTDGGDRPICAVRYAWEVPGGGGDIALEFSCEEQLLPLYRSEFDAIARTLHLPPDDETSRHDEAGRVASAP